MTNEHDNELPAIEFRHVSLSFDERRALDDVSFTLQRGQTIFITGVSGSGKSVLLHLAMSLLKADAGEIFVEGHEVGQMRESELLVLRGNRMGMVFQEQSLFTALSVFDNVAFRLDEHGWKEADIERAVMETLKFVGLETDLDKMPEELSGGMRRRLEFARAMVGWPSIMLFDEPASGLDPPNARAMLDLITRARDIHHISSLYVTKELHEITYLASHAAVQDEAGNIAIHTGERHDAQAAEVMVLDEGRIVFSGSPAAFDSSTLPAVTRLTHPTFSRSRVETSRPLSR